MMRQKRLTAALLALVLVLAACNGSGGSSGSTTDGGSDTTVAEDGSGDGDTGATPLEGVAFTGTFMEFPYAAAVEVEVPGFEELTGAEFTVVGSPFEVLNTQMINDLATGTGEFSLMSGEFWIGAVWDRMAPLDDRVTDEFADRYLPGIWGEGPSGFSGGHRVGVPFSGAAYGLAYRTDIFEEAGLTAEWETWDDYFATMEALEAHKAETGAEWDASVHSWAAAEQVPILWMAFYDGYFLDAEGNYALDEPKAAAALDEMARLVEYNPSGALGLSIDEAIAAFTGGDTATFIGWPGFLRVAAQDPTSSEIVDNWQVAEMPGPGFPFVSAWNFFISGDATPEQADAAWAFIEYFTDYERSKQRFYDFGMVPPVTEFFEDPDIVAEFGHDLPYEAANINRSKSVPWTFEVFEIYYRNVGEFLQGNLTAEETISIVVEGWSGIEVPQPLAEAAASQGLVQEG